MATTPGAPNIKVFPLASPSTLQYWWKPPTEGGADVTDYELTVTPGPYTFRLAGGATYCTVEGLSDGTFYSASIRATCNYPEWGPSSVFYEWQPGLPPSYAPQTPFVVRDGRSNALVSWTPPATIPNSPIFWYVIRSKSTTPADPSPEYTASGTTDSNVYITGLVSSSTYYFTLEAVNCPGYSPFISTNWIRFWPFLIQVVWDTTFMDSGIGTGTNYTGTLDLNNNLIGGGIYNTASTADANLINVSGVGNTTSPVTLRGTTVGWPYLVKYNTNGIVQWATNVINQSSWVIKTKTDIQGNIYCLGAYSTSGTVIDASGNGRTPSGISLSAPTGGRASFLIKYNTNGIAQWATFFDVTGSTDWFQDMVLDSSGNIYIVGYYNSATSVILKNATATGQTDSSYTIGATTSDGAFIVKYSTSGLVQWATRIDGTSSESSTAVNIDSSGNIYVGGTYSTGPITLQNASGTGQANSSFTLSTNGSNGAYFLVKYDSNGQVIWAANMRTANAGTNPLTSIAVDNNNNIYITGRYTSTSGQVIVQSASGTGQVDSSIRIQTSVGSTDVFLVKYNSNGIAQWATKMQSNGDDYVNSVCCDNSGYVYVTGYYQSTGTFGIQNASGTTQVPSRYSFPATGSTTIQKLFLVKYNSEGQAQVAYRPSSTSEDEGWSVCVDSSYTIYLFGNGNVQINDPVYVIDNITYEGTIVQSNRNISRGVGPIILKLTQPV